MKTEELLNEAEIKDTFIREVRVNYVHTSQCQFLINGPFDAASFVRSVLPDNSREHFIALYLDGGHQIASYSLISTGTANSAQVHPREVFQRAVVTGCCALIVAHNHPSGNLVPSDADMQFTKRLEEAGELLGIKLLDSLVISDYGAYSIKEAQKV